MDVGPVGVRPHHRLVAVAEHELDLAVLVRLEPGRLAELVAELGVLRRRHRAQHVPGAVQLLEDPGDPAEHLERRLQAIGGDGVPCAVQLVQREASSRALTSGAA